MINCNFSTFDYSLLKFIKCGLRVISYSHIIFSLFMQKYETCINIQQHHLHTITLVKSLKPSFQFKKKPQDVFTSSSQRLTSVLEMFEDETIFAVQSSPCNLPVNIMVGSISLMVNSPCFYSHKNMNKLPIGATKCVFK